MSRRRVVASILAVIVIVMIGALAGGMGSYPGPRYSAGAQILVTGLDNSRGGPYSVGQYVLDRMKTWALVAEGDGVADAAASRLGEPARELRGQVSATAPTGRADLVLEVAAPRPDQAVRRAGAVATTLAETISAQESPGDPAGPRVAAAVISVDDSARDEGAVETRRGAVLGAVLGALLAWTLLALIRPGSWLPPRTRPSAGEDAELRRLDRIMQVEVLDALLLGQRTRGVLVGLAAVLGILGYALTASPIPPLIVILAAGVAGRRDLRFAAGGILYAGVTALPPKVNVVDLGVITPTLLEIAVLIGVALLVTGPRRCPLRGTFTGPVLAILGALVVGAVVGLANGADVSDVVGTARSMSVLAAFFVFREAFHGRPYQLFGIVLVMCAVVCTIAVLSVPLGLTVLQSEGANDVVTGSTTTELARLYFPVLRMTSPILVIVAAGVIRLRPRWLVPLLLVPYLLLEALSFTRTTWAVLAALAIVVASLRFGSRGLLVRAAAVVGIGVLTFGVLQAGVAGEEGEALAARVTSVVTGEAITSDSLGDRLRENEHAWSTLGDSPIVGTGLEVPYGAELIEYDANQNILVSTPRHFIHNQYLRVWLWMGVIGLLAYGWLAVRIVTFAVHDRVRRGRASTFSVACALGLGALAVQSVLATNLDHPPAIIAVAVVLAIAELSAAPTVSHGWRRSDRTNRPSDGSAGDPADEVPEPIRPRGASSGVP